MSKRILFVIGSFRQQSFNHQLAEVAEKILIEKGATVTYLDYQDLPHFCQDIELPTPPAVQAVRDAVLAADVVWFFSPVYNYSVPGILKNFLDWISRALDLADTTGPSAIHHKVTTVSAVAHDGHQPLFEEFDKVLNFIRTKPVGTFTAAPVIPETAWQDNRLEISDQTLAALTTQVDAVLEALNH